MAVGFEGAWWAAWLLSLLGFGVRRDASTSRRGVLEFDDPMEMEMMESSLLCFVDRVAGSKVFGGGWDDVWCVCGCVCLPLFFVGVLVFVSFAVYEGSYTPTARSR